METSIFTLSPTSEEEFRPYEDFLAYFEPINPDPTEDGPFSTHVFEPEDNLETSLLGFDEAAISSGNGTGSTNVHFDNNDGLEARGEPPAVEEALCNKEGENRIADSDNVEQAPRCRRRKRRVSFKRLGSVGRPFYRAKVPKNREPFTCYRCHAQFTFKYQLEYHLREHSGAQLLHCDFCPMEFPTGRMLASHCSRKHGHPSLDGLGNQVKTLAEFH